MNPQKSFVIMLSSPTYVTTTQFSMTSLGFPVKNLPIIYLSPPISGEKKSYNHCLSYGGRIQLVNWIIASKYNTYWAQGVTLSEFVISKVGKSTY